MPKLIVTLAALSAFCTLSCDDGPQALGPEERSEARQGDTLEAPDGASLGEERRTSPAPMEPIAPFSLGPYPPSHTTLSLEGGAREGALTVELWYPGVSAPESPAAIESFEADPEDRARLAELILLAPPECPSQLMASLRDGPAQPDLGPLPLVVFSHCVNCGRYASFSLAERLASHGILVVAADHAGPMPFLPEAVGEPLDAEQLERRAAEVMEVIDAAIDGRLFGLSALSAGLSVDPEKIGAFGHSFGSVTTGLVAQSDPRIRAAAGLAAPMASLLFPAVSLEEIDVPLFFVLAEEDNSIMELGNDFLRDNAAEASPPTWLVSIADAGHWSVSDLCGLSEAFDAGCGEGVRHSKGAAGEPFDYRAPTEVISIVAERLTTFFLAHLTGAPEAHALLKALPPHPGVMVTTRLE